MGLTKVKKTFQIDSADRDTTKYPTNGDYVVHLPRTYKNVTSLRLKGAEINSSFNPTSIPGCALWLDAADSTSVIQTDNTVTQWTDKSGNGNNATQPTLINRPTYSNDATYLNNGIYFGKTALPTPPPAQFLSITNTNLLSNVPYAGMFIVSRIGTQQTQNGAQRGTAFLATIGGGGGNGRFLISLALNSTNLNPGTFARRLDTDALTATDSTVPLSLNTTNMVFGEANYQARILTNFINGTQVNSAVTYNFTSGNTQASSSTVITINSSLANNRLCDTYIYEIILYTSPLTLAQRQQIEGYLAWKWGLQTSLPTTHPYFQLANFIPTSISDSLLWLDAADPSSVILNGTNVSQWTDKSGKNNHMFNNILPNSRVSYDSRNGVGFSTANTSVLQTTNNITYSNSFDVYFVARLTSPVGLNYAINFSGSNAGDWSARYSDGVFQSGAGFISTALINGISITGTMTYANTYSNYTIINGNTNAIPPNNNPGAIQLSTSGFGGSRYFNGFIQEVIIYSTRLSTAQRQQVEGYLAWKWGLQNNLASSHPYSISNLRGRVDQNIAIRNYNTTSSLTNDLLLSSPIYYFLIEIEGLNKNDETRVNADKSSFIDKYFGKIPMITNSQGIIRYNDKNLQENIAYYRPAIENLDRLKIKLRTHAQQDGSGFIYFRNDYNLTFEIEYLENTFDSVKI